MDADLAYVSHRVLYHSNMFDLSISERTDFIYGFNKIPKDNLQYSVRYIHTYPLLPGMIQKAQSHACTVDFNKCNPYNLQKNVSHDS